MLRCLGLAVAVATSAALLGGCVVIKSGPTPIQQNVTGDVRVTLTICRSTDPSTNPGCADDGNSNEYISGDSQVLLAFRIPAGASAPQSFASTAGVALTFSPSESYRAELDRLVPAPAGQKWAAYISGIATVDEPAMGAPAPESTIAADFGLPAETPYVGPFTVRAVVGTRAVSAASADRPVECGPDPYASYPPYSPLPDLVVPEIICVDSPDPVFMASSVPLATRDFGVVAGNATASPGQTVSMPFNVRGAGALPAGLTATLSGGTSLPGATAAPSLPSAPLANGSDTRVTVPVAIPAGAAAGAYDVTLTGRLDNGQARTGVAKLTVRARATVPDTRRPVLSRLSIEPKAFKPATRNKPRRGATVAYALSEAASVRVVVERCSKYAKPKRRKAGARRSAAAKRGRCVRFAALRGALTKTGRAGANSFRFDGRVRGKALKPGSYRLAARPTDPAGNAGAVVRRAGFAIRR